jgi:hypothetical protein
MIVAGDPSVGPPRGAAGHSETLAVHLLQLAAPEKMPTLGLTRDDRLRDYDQNREDATGTY